MTKRYGLKTPLLARSEDFKKVFEDNEQHVQFRASARLGSIRLQVHSRNQEHFQRTLEYWRKLKATNIEEEYMKYNCDITWGFAFYAEQESDLPTQQFTLLEPTDDDDKAYAAARALVSVDPDVHVNVDMGDTGVGRFLLYRAIRQRVSAHFAG